jgi:hypothetical protein
MLIKMRISNQKNKILTTASISDMVIDGLMGVLLNRLSHDSSFILTWMISMTI